MIYENENHLFTKQRTLGRASPFFSVKHFKKSKEVVSNPARLFFYFLSQKFHMLWIHSITSLEAQMVIGHTRKTGNNSPAFQQSQLNVLFSEIPLRSFCVLQFNISFTTERISNASFLLTKLLSSQQTRQKPSLNHHISPFRP